MPHAFDVAIVGGGAAGAACALTLARQGRRVLLLDDAPAGKARVGESLPPAARPLLRDLGVLERFLGDGHLTSHGNVSVWGTPVPAVTDFLYDRNGHGWQLDRVRFDALLRAAARDAGAHVREGSRVTAVEKTPEMPGRPGTPERPGRPGRPDARCAWRLVIADREPTALGCDWLVDATGRRCVVARQLGAVRAHDDALVAFHARFRAEAGRVSDRDARTWIESVPGGWWYTALVPAGERVVAFLTDEDLADRRLHGRDGFLAELAHTRHVRALLDAHGYALHGRPRGADARSARLDRFAGQRWLATGDAAQAFDPLSSQGMLTALYTGMKAGQAVHAALAGDSAAVAGYAQRLAQIQAAYQRNRTSFYALERRWAEHPFWRRRSNASGTPAT